jgi:hypothetical protein
MTRARQQLEPHVVASEELSNDHTKGKSFVLGLTYPESCFSCTTNCKGNYVRWVGSSG